MKLRQGAQTSLTLEEVNRLSRVDVDQFYGIEIVEWPARIAEVALWLMDHQMNIKVSESFGQLYQRLPLKKSPHVKIGNALRFDWQSVLTSSECSYVLGNPPFVGKHLMQPEQSSDMQRVWGEASGVLDYVTGWYRKAAEYIQGTAIVVGFVSTNSITQGEQPGILWKPLFDWFHLKIHFAYRTFFWTSEARGMAHVHVVIIGFAAYDVPEKHLYEATSATESATTSSVANISPYLTAGNDIAVLPRRSASKKTPTQLKAQEPTLFAEIRQPTARYMLLPQHSSETRTYIPFGYFDSNVILHNSCTALPDATPYHFGVLSSLMHMAWTKQVAGRIKSDIRYSNTLVYNNFPWPESTSEKQRAAVERAAEAVLETRKQFPGSTLSDLYDPRTMPPDLQRAHKELDRAVDRCYRAEAFISDRQRVEYLFLLYEKLTAPLLPAPAKRRRAGGRARA